ncbi:MAG: tetratricopeptide repeat protein [bacterium]
MKLIDGEERTLRVVEYYKGLLERDPTLPIFVKLADILVGLGKLNDAKVVAKEGLIHNPKLPDGWTVMARISRELGEIDKASEYITEALKLDHFNVDSLMEEALILMEMGEEEKALSSLDKALEIDRDNEDIKKLRASIKAKFRFAEVKDYIDRSRKRRVGVSTERAEVVETGEEMAEREEKLVSPYLAEVYLRQGYLSKAREVCEIVLMTNPTDEKAMDILNQIEKAELSMKDLSGEVEIELAPVPKVSIGEEGETEFEFVGVPEGAFSELQLEEEILTEPIMTDMLSDFDFNVIDIELPKKEEKPSTIGEKETKQPETQIPIPEDILVISKPPQLELPEDIDISELDTEEEDISKFQEWLDKLILE